MKTEMKFLKIVQNLAIFGKIARTPTEEKKILDFGLNGILINKPVQHIFIIILSYYSARSISIVLQS